MTQPTGDPFDVGRVTWVLNEQQLNRLVEALRSVGEVCYDLETTGKSEWAEHAAVVLASFTMPNGDTWVLPLYHSESPWQGVWRSVFTRVVTHVSKIGWTGHNAKYDARWSLRFTGVDLAPSLVWDTMLSAHLLDERSSRKLKDVAPALFGIQRWDDVDLTKPGAALAVPLIDLGLYAARDTYWTHRLVLAHRERLYVGIDEEPYDSDEIEDARLGRLMHWVVMPTVRTLCQMEQTGFLLDREWVNARIETEIAVRDAQFAWLSTRYPDVEGKPSFAPTSIYFRRWTAAATEAGDLRVTAMTKKGKPQWSKSVLMRQARDGCEIAERLLAYRGAVKRLEYLRAWLVYQAVDGAVHASFNVIGTVTGRTSSSGPNLQQVTKVLRPAFVAPPGHVVVDLDYSQIELRIAAHVSGSKAMIEAFQRGDDLHTMLASRITGKAEHQVSSEDRQRGKSANFGLLYGMGSLGFRLYAEDVYGVTMSAKEAQAAHQAFFDTWDGMREWHARSAATAERTGQVVSPIGRVRRLPAINSIDDRKASHAVRQAINSPVQGFASDLMQIAAASIAGQLPGHSPIEGMTLVATVHDSIVGYVPEDRASLVVEECRERMVSAVLDVLRRLDCDLKVPLVADATVGTRWGLSDIDLEVIDLHTDDSAGAA